MKSWNDIRGTMVFGATRLPEGVVFLSPDLSMRPPSPDSESIIALSMCLCGKGDESPEEGVIDGF